MTVAVAERIGIPAAILAGPNAHAEYIVLNGRSFWTTGQRVIDFIESLCTFSNGRWTGEKFVLQPWQKRFLFRVFEINPVTGLRRYRRVLLGTARKSGKTELAAALALYFAVADGEKSAEVYCAASSEEQADRVFMAARRMCEGGTPLADLVRVPEGEKADYLTSLADPYSSLKRLTSKGKTKHGLNISAVILDELHVWGVGEADELWSALTTGMAARLQPMMIMITTAGTDIEESRCGGLYEAGRAMERGEVDDDGFYFEWWSAADDADYRDPEAWRAANPNYGVTVNEAFLAGELAGTNIAGGKRKPAISVGEFRRLYLNQWVDYAVAPWVTPEQLAVCLVAPFELIEHRATWAGIDLSETRDSSAVAHAQWWDGGARPCGHDGDPCLYLRVRVWEPPRGPNGRIIENVEIPQAEIRQHLRDMAARYDVRTNVFDPWHSRLMAQDLEAEGLTVEQIWQTGARRSGASAALYDLIHQRRLHFCDDAFERHCLAATTKPAGTDGGYYLAKRKRGRVMDAAMAAVNVVYGTTHAPADGVSVYETRGVRST